MGGWRECVRGEWGVCGVGCDVARGWTIAGLGQSTYWPHHTGHVQRTDEKGHNYYEVEFTADNGRFVRHQLAVVAAADGESQGSMGSTWIRWTWGGGG